MAASKAFEIHRPPHNAGRGDSHLPRLIGDLRQFLTKTQNDFTQTALRLTAGELATPAHVLVEFGEDLHNNTFATYPLRIYGSRP